MDGLTRRNMLSTGWIPAFLILSRQENSHIKSHKPIARDYSRVVLEHPSSNHPSYNGLPLRNSINMYGHPMSLLEDGSKWWILGIGTLVVCLIILMVSASDGVLALTLTNYYSPVVHPVFLRFELYGTKSFVALSRSAPGAESVPSFLLFIYIYPRKPQPFSSIWNRTGSLGLGLGFNLGCIPIGDIVR